MLAKETRDCKSAERQWSHAGTGGWRQVLELFERLPEQEILRRQQDVLRQMRANGIAYGSAGQQPAGDRPWNLDLVPLVVEQQDWQQLEQALAQRARLKRALMRDIYGAQTILKDGVIPPALLFSHQGYIRAVRHTPHMHELPLYGADVCRLPGGKWYVTNDLSQSAAGAGYALENRAVLSCVLPNLFMQHRVSRLAGYFRALQELLTGSGAPDTRCVMLGYSTSGPHCFEHAYLSKYLGYTLVELNDLIVKEEYLWIKTVCGLQRVDVILRFIDDRDADPLISNSSVGLPGLLQVVRAGNVRIVNPIGTGVLANPGFNAYETALFRHLLQEEPELSSAPTWWLGDDVQRRSVSDRAKDLLYRQIDGTSHLVDPRRMDDQQWLRYQEAVNLQPWRYVAQQRMQRESSPVLDGTATAMQHSTLRCFLAATDQGYSAMPGGLCLLDTQDSGSQPLFDAFEGSKDTWVPAGDSPAVPSLLPMQRDDSPFAIAEDELPSRAAENLYWLGRYTERAENSIRVLRAICEELQNEEVYHSGAKSDRPLDALFQAVTAVTGTTEGFAGEAGRSRREAPDAELLSLFTDTDRDGTLAYTLQRMQTTASTLRDRLSPELIGILNTLEDQQQQLQHQMQQAAFSSDPYQPITTHEQLNAMLSSLAAFSGLAYENLAHADGWRFLMLGRRIDRARQSAAAIRSLLATSGKDEHVHEILLRLFDSLMIYRSRYRSQVDAKLVMQLIVLDENNPRSIAFQFSEIDQLIRSRPGMRRDINQSPLRKAAISGLSRVRLADAAQLISAGTDSRQNLGMFLTVLERIPEEINSVLTAAYFTHTEIKKYLEAMSVSRPPRKTSAAAKGFESDRDATSHSSGSGE